MEHRLIFRVEQRWAGQGVQETRGHCGQREGKRLRSASAEAVTRTPEAPKLLGSGTLVITSKLQPLNLAAPLKRRKADTDTDKTVCVSGQPRPPFHPPVSPNHPQVHCRWSPRGASPSLCAWEAPKPLWADSDTDLPCHGRRAPPARLSPHCPVLACPSAQTRRHVRTGTLSDSSLGPHYLVLNPAQTCSVSTCNDRAEAPHSDVEPSSTPPI